MGGRKRGRATAAVSRQRLWEGKVEQPMRQRKGNESTYGGIAATPSRRRSPPSNARASSFSCCQPSTHPRAPPPSEPYLAIDRGSRLAVSGGSRDGSGGHASKALAGRSYMSHARSA